MQIIEEDWPILVVAEDGRFAWLVYLVWLGVCAAIAIACGLAALTEGTGAFFLALFCLIDYARSERWEFDGRAGAVTRTRRVLFVAPLRRRWPLSAVRRVEVRERTDSDGDTERALILHLAWETVTITRLNTLGSDGVQALAGKIRATARAAAPPRARSDTGSAPSGQGQRGSLDPAHKALILAHGPIGVWRAAWGGTALALGSDEVRFRPDGTGHIDAWFVGTGPETIEFAWRVVGPGRLRLRERGTDVDADAGETPTAVMAREGDEVEVAVEFRTLWSDAGPVEVLVQVGQDGFWYLAKPLHWIGP